MELTDDSIRVLLAINGQASPVEVKLKTSLTAKIVAFQIKTLKHKGLIAGRQGRFSLTKSGKETLEKELKEGDLKELF